MIFHVSHSTVTIIKLTLSVLTAMVTLYLFQIASYTSPYCPPPSLCFITMSVLGSRELFIFHLNMPSLSWGVKNFLSFILNMPSLSWGVENFLSFILNMPSLFSSRSHQCDFIVTRIITINSNCAIIIAKNVPLNALRKPQLG